MGPGFILEVLFVWDSYGITRISFEKFNPSDDSQKWWFRNRNNDGFVSIVNPAMGRVLEFHDDGTAELGLDNGSDSQLFSIVDHGIRNKKTNKFLEDSNRPHRGAQQTEFYIALKFVNV